nr:hypothetical protein [Ktedonobacteraceae bacterium]
MGSVRAAVEANNRKFEQAFHTVKRPGKYVVVWKQEGGDWRLDVDIWNS